MHFSSLISYRSPQWAVLSDEGGPCVSVLVKDMVTGPVQIHYLLSSAWEGKEAQQVPTCWNRSHSVVRDFSTAWGWGFLPIQSCIISPRHIPAAQAVCSGRIFGQDLGLNAIFVGWLYSLKNVTEVMSSNSSHWNRKASSRSYIEKGKDKMLQSKKYIRTSYLISNIVPEKAPTISTL